MITEARTREWLSPKELAHELRVHVSTVYRAVESGRLPAVRLTAAGSLRIPRDEIERLIEEAPQ